jgi:hypothetical protein
MTFKFEKEQFILEWTYSLMNKILIQTNLDKHFTTAERASQN